MNKLAASRLVPLIAASLLLAGVPAQDESSRGGASQGFVLEAGDHDIAELISRAATFLGRNLIVQQQELAANRDNLITLQKSLNLDVSGCEEVVSQLAWLKGLVMSPVDPKRGIYEFISVRGQRRGDIRTTFMTPEKIVQRPQLKILVSTSLRLEHIDAMRAAQYLRPILATGSRNGLPLTFGSLGTRHALMLRGLADEVANAIQMVSLMDIPEAETTVAGVNERLADLEKEKVKLRRELAALRKRLQALEGNKR